MTNTLSTEQGPRRGPRWSRLAGIAFGAAAMVGIGSALALRNQELPGAPPVGASSTDAATGAGNSVATPPPASTSGTPVNAQVTGNGGTDHQGDGRAGAPARTEAPPAPGPDAAAMVAKLEQRLRHQPEDREGWMMLARAYGVMGRDKEAVEVYRRLVALSPQDNSARAQAHADLGRAIGKANGRKLTPEADAELQKALALEPGNVMAHALLGRTDLERGDAPGAKRHWEKALEGVDSSHPFAQQLRQSIEVADNMIKAQAAGPNKEPASP